MSGFVSPTDKEQVPYECMGCHIHWSMPASALRGDEIDGIPIHDWRIKNGVPTRCLSCALILGAIDKLNALVFREPWLLTEGLAGEPKKAAWEMVDVAEKDKTDSGHGESGRSSAGDGRSMEESMVFREMVMQNFMKTAGEGFVEAEEKDEQEQEQAQK